MQSTLGVDENDYRVVYMNYEARWLTVTHQLRWPIVLTKQICSRM